MAIPSKGGTATPVLATDPNGDLTPAVSPDGTKLAHVIASPIKQAPAGYAVAVIDLATKRRLATIPSAPHRNSRRTLGRRVFSSLFY